jgi:2-hydroxycyclohexanecarboxyl-CoA dehydrogenase
MNRVADKAALITGGGAGIGAATGELICAEGGMALLVDANAAALAGTTKAIAAKLPGARVSTFVADVADPAAAVHAVAHAYILRHARACPAHPRLSQAQKGRHGWPGQARP